MKRAWALLAAAFTMTLASHAGADDTSSEQPYIDQLKKNIQPNNSEGYSDQLKKKLAPEQSPEGYTNELRRENPDLQLQGTPEPYTEEQRKIIPKKEEGGAIAAVQRGETDQRRIKSTDIHNAFGIRIGMLASRNYSPNYGIGTGRAFTDVYGSGFSPDVALFYEHQLFHSESYASFGVFGMIDIARYSGLGTFQVALKSPFDNSPIPASATGTTYYFWEFPVTAGAVFRLNLAKYVRPYFMAGPMTIGFAEYRSDGGNTNRGLSFGAFGAIGVAFMLDNISKDVDWDAYSDLGVKHTYFTIEYAGTYCIPESAVSFNGSGLVGGFTFEY